jgi:hypothetical protein
MNHENILFGFTEIRKNNSASKRQNLGPTFSGRPQRGRALPEFGRTKLSTKKVGNKIVMGGEGVVQKKLDPIFASSRLNYFSGFLFIIGHQQPTAIKTTIYFFRASLDEQTTKTYFSGLRKTEKFILKKLGPTFPSRDQRGRALPEFGRTKLSTKKVGTKFS